MTDEHLAHYGVIGMKWGVRKDGKPQGFQYKKKGSSAVKEFVDKQVKKRISNRISTIRTDEELRKKTGLSRSEFEKLRQTTLKSNDPRVVEKGMQTLSDKELASKISRLTTEKKVRDLSSDVSIKEANARKAQEEAKKAKKERRAAGLGARTINSVTGTALQIGKSYVLHKLGIDGKSKPESKKESSSTESLLNEINSIKDPIKDPLVKLTKKVSDPIKNAVRTEETYEPKSKSDTVYNDIKTAKDSLMSLANVKIGKDTLARYDIIDVEPVESSRLSEERKKK